MTAVNGSGGQGWSKTTMLALAALSVASLARPERKEPLTRVRAPDPETPGSAKADGAQPNAGGLAAATIEHRPGLIGLARSIIDRFSRDNTMMTAASIAFYALLSIFPALAAIVSVYALVGDPNDVSRQIAPFAQLLPPEAMKLLNDGLATFIKTASESHISIKLIFSILVAIWSARAAMSSVMSGLNIAYEESERRSFIVTVLVSLALTLGAVAFAIVAIGAIAVVPAMLALVHLDKVVENLLEYGRWPILAVLVILAFAVMFRFAPDRSHPRWRWITWGSGFSAVLWLIGSILFSFYVSHFGSYDATYGSIGAVIVLLLWFWVSAIIMLLGASIDSELDTRATIGGSPTAGTPPRSGPPTDKGNRTAAAR